MPMGFKNAPAIFQRFVDTVLKDEIGKACFVYVDDILIFGRSKVDHDVNLKRVMNKLIEAGLQGNESKCLFGQKEAEFLGHRIAYNEIKPLDEIKDTIIKFKQPTNIEEVRRFLGLVNYYRKFIPNCANILEPISKLLTKDIKFEWGKEEKTAFEKSKCALNSTSVLTQPNFNKEFILETDASNTGLGAILSQEYEGNTKPIAYASRSLTSTERNYSITEKEMLGAIWAMEHFKYYLYGREFKLRTDHKALEAFNTKGYLESARIQRWMDRIQIFDFVVEYQKGESIPHVDALSRQFGNDIVNEIRSERNKEELIWKIHEELIHRGAKTVYEELRKRGIEDISLEETISTIRNCRKCKLYNPIKSKPHRIIEAFRPGERVAVDTLELGKGKNILVAIDYFTRRGYAKYSRSKSSEEILSFIKAVHNL